MSSAVREGAPAGALPVRRESSRQWRRMVRIDGWGALLLPLVAFLLLVFVAPLVMTLAKSVTDPTPGLQNYRDLVANPLYLRVLANTFTTALAVTVVTLLLAFPYAYLMTLAGPRWRAVLLAVVLVPFWTSLLVRSFALVLLLRDSGVFNTALMGAGLVDAPVPLIRNLTGVLFGMVQVTLPFAVLPIYATMRTIDRRLVQAAEGLGARPSSAFWRVFVPLTAPGVAAGSLLVFIQALGFYITPTLLGGPKNMMVGELIVQQVSSVLNFGFAAALATVLLVTTFLLLAVASRFVDLRRYVMGRP
ncbi:MAG TPA: ABC transporter permease [Mycobacteriales bacterium]